MLGARDRWERSHELGLQRGEKPSACLDERHGQRGELLVIDGEKLLGLPSTERPLPCLAQHRVSRPQDFVVVAGCREIRRLEVEHTAIEKSSTIGGGPTPPPAGFCGENHHAESTAVTR